MLGFSISVSDKLFIRNTTEICQILPVQRGFLNDKIIETYYKGINNRNNVLIHVSYMCRLFSPAAFTYESKIKALLRQYIKLAKRIRTNDILIHGPSNTNEFKNFVTGLELIKSTVESENYKGSIHIEIPCFSKELLESMSNKFKFCEEYLDTISKFNFGIVFDTAHTFNNGLTNEEVIKLMKKYNKYVTWVHLNGNIRPPSTSDNHCPMFDPKNLIPDYIQFCSDIAKLNKKCISETIHKEYKDWEDFCKQTNFKLVSKNSLDRV
jgi:endonuclease IV